MVIENKRDFQSMCRRNISVLMHFAINTIICQTLDCGFRTDSEREMLLAYCMLAAHIY